MKARFLAAALALVSTTPAYAQRWPGGPSYSTAIGQSGAPPPRTATLYASPSLPGITIPNNFVGISVEGIELTGTGYYQGNTGANGTFASLINLLGNNGVIRVGGISSDYATCLALTQTIANNFNTFRLALGTNWTVIWGLDLMCNSPSTAATAAQYMVNAVGAANLTFQFGNEANAYLTPASAFITRWNTYYSAVSAQVSGVKYDCCDLGNFATTTSYYTGLTLPVTSLAEVTYHWYDLTATVFSASQLVSSFHMFANATGFWSVLPSNQGVPGRISESNTVSSGGTAGLSDRLAASTWFLDQAIGISPYGYSGINIHNAYAQFFTTPPGGVYNAVILLGDGNFGPGPIFYGMLAFSKVEGQQIIPLGIGTNGNIAALATLGPNGNSNFIVANNDVNNSITVYFQQPGAWTTANVWKVSTADGLNCLSAQPTWGGAVIGEGGAWAGSSYSISNVAGVTLAPCESAFVSIQP